MPYIKQEDRAKWDKLVDEVFNNLHDGNARNILPFDRVKGELNYFICRILARLLLAYGSKYCVMQDILGLLDAVRSEYYRRIVSPYEDWKIEENGDVFNEFVLFSGQFSRSNS